MNTTDLLYNKLIRLLKGIVILYMTSQFNHYCTVCAQIPIPKTQNEWNNQLTTDLRDLNCNKRFSRDTECSSSKKNRGRGRNRKRNSGADASSSSEQKKQKRCRCKRNKRPRDNRNERAMLDDHRSPAALTFNFPPPRPRLKICRDARCLTFTNGRKSFNAPEYLIVSHSNYIEVLEGAWELCGEFQKSISCVIMSDTNYLDIFDDESVRVTTFRKLEIPDRIPDSLDTDSHEDFPRDVANEMEAMSNELSGLADNINKMEDVLDKSNELLMLDRHQRPKMRRKFMRVLDTLGDS